MEQVRYKEVTVEKDVSDFIGKSFIYPGKNPFDDKKFCFQEWPQVKW